MEDVHEGKRGLTKNLKYFFGIGDFFFNTMTQVQDVYFNFFLTNIAMFGLDVVTFIQTATNTVIALISWIYGAIISGTKPMRWGRNRSWLIVVPWIVPFIYMFKFKVIGDGGGFTIALIIGASIVASILWNFSYVANLGLINVIGKTPEERLQLSANRGAYNRASTITFSFMGLPLANLLATVVGEENKFAALAFTTGVMMAVGFFIHFKLSAGYESRETDAQAARANKAEKASIGGMLRSLFQNGPVLVLVIADTARWIANFVIMGCLMYYFTYVAHNTGMQATYMLIANSCCVLGALGCKAIGKKLGTRNTVIAGFFVLGGGLILARVFFQNPIAVIACMAFAQMGYGTIYSLTPALFSDASIYAEWKTGEDASTWIMGLGNVPLNIALMARGLIINGILAMVGFSASIDPATASIGVQAGISNAMLLVPGAIVLCGGLLLLFGFRIKAAQVTKMSEEIRQRRGIAR